MLLGLLVGVFFIALGVAGTVNFADGLKYSTRVSGTPGLLDIYDCVSYGSGKSRSTECLGVFRSDDHRVVDKSASISSPHKAGTLLPVQRDADGHYHMVGVAATAGRLAGIFASVWGVIAGLACFCGAFSTLMPQLGKRIGAAVWSPAATRRVRLLCWALGIGFAACGVVGVIAWLVTP